MASFFGSPAFISHPLTRVNCSLSQTPPPNPSPSSLPQPPKPESSKEEPTSQINVQQQQELKPLRTGNNSSTSKVETTDWIASTLTRRFGLGAGLAWFAFLAVGVVSEQIKTRLEVSQQEASTRNVEKEEEVVLTNGLKYYELRVGGGASPQTGDLVVINLKGSVEGSGEVFVDTFGKKPLALVIGSKAPYTRGMCEGIEYGLRTMKAGGKRRVIVPPHLGFGEDGAEISSVQIPPQATLDYIVEVEKVSIAPV